ncbi:MAG: A/G-specific adenine glycosylase [Candidatus Aminicenantes bacterium]|nr:A/G-specific adenine glycosylase [Candidatus Aminicenantes bacterium]
MKEEGGPVIDAVARLLHWFERNRRDLPWRRRRDLYAVWVSEVMLQQTRVETVIPYFRRFLKRFPSLRRLAAASLQDVLKAWEGLGYYSRARSLWSAARQVRANYRGRIPRGHEEFRALPGVGEYIAAAVLSIGGGLAVPVVDGNVLRVACRWRGFAGDIRRQATKKKVHRFLCGILPQDSPGRFNEALMELGALVCLPRNPRCPACPLRGDCFAFGHSRTGSLPRKGRRRPVPLHRVALAAIVRNGRIYIQQRPERGHLGGLWELPGGKCRAGEKPQDAVGRECREELGAELDVLAKLAEVRHAYSHFRVQLHVFMCRPRSGRIRTPRPHAWIKADELEKYPFPAANHKFMKELMDFIATTRRTAYGRRRTVLETPGKIKGSQRERRREGKVEKRS